jgi:gluconokinase
MPIMPIVTLADAEAPLVLTLDVGSSSLRASFFDRYARPVEDCQVRTRYQFVTTSDGGVEKDADELFQITCDALDQILQLVGNRANHIKAVALDTFWHTVMGVDKNYNPVTPLFSWADTRSAAYAEQLRRELDERAVHSRTGCLFHASYYPAKLRWLADTQPSTYRRVAHWISFGEYFYQKLFGKHRASISIASATGLFNQFTCQWDAPTLELLSLTEDKLAPLIDLDNPFSGLLPEYAQRWQPLKDIAWFPAIGDGAAGNIGSGCYTPNNIALMIGTSGAMRVVWSEKEIKKKLEVPWGLWRYRVDRHRPVLGGALSEGGNLFAWMNSTLALPNPSDVEDELSMQAPDGHGLTVLPFLAGERAPGWASHARAAIIGISLDTNAIEILRAGLESIAYRFGLLFSLLEPAVLAGVKSKYVQVVASGGALTKSPTWAQIIADVLNHPVALSSEPESSSRGTAILALEQIVGQQILEEVNFDCETTYQPNPQRHHVYQAAVQRQQKLYQAIIQPE